MKVLVLGGSNSVMREGYVQALMKALRLEKGLKIEGVRNVAVGANNCVHGVEIMAGLDYLAEIDLLFIEYTMNDVGLATPEAWPTWRASFEAIVRMALAERPDMSIVIAGFGRLPKNDKQRAKYGPRQEMLFAAMDEIAAHYAPWFDVRHVNVDAHLRRIAPSDKEFAALYADEAHYKRPEISTLVGRYIAEHVEPGSVARSPAPLPSPLAPFVFDSAALLPMPLAFPEADCRLFQNSRFSLNTAVLVPGRRYHMTLPGSLIALSFCASPESSGLLVEEEGEAPFVIDTLHTAPRDKIFPFLVKQHPLDWKDWTGEDIATPRRLTLQPLAKDEYATAAGTYLPRFSMVQPTDEAPKAFMHAALCYRPSGTRDRPDS